MKKVSCLGCALMMLFGVAGCRTSSVPETPMPVQEKAKTVDFEAAAQTFSDRELWRIEEKLAELKKSGRVNLNDETLFFTLLELTPERDARQRATAWRSRFDLLAAGAEFVRRSALDEILRGKLQNDKDDATYANSLRPLYLANHRAKLAATLRVRRLLNLTPEAELTSAALCDWPDADFPFLAEASVTDFQHRALSGRAELGNYSGNFPDVFREMQRIPTGRDFPLARFAALPAALAEKRAASPEMDWRFAAAYAAAIGIREEIWEAYCAWQQCADAAETAAKVADSDDAATFGKAECELKRDLAGCRVLGAVGYFEDKAPEKLRPPTPAEQLAAAWVTDYLLNRGE